MENVQRSAAVVRKESHAVHAVIVINVVHHWLTAVAVVSLPVSMAAWTTSVPLDRYVY